VLTTAAVWFVVQVFEDLCRQIYKYRADFLERGDVHEQRNKFEPTSGDDLSEDGDRDEMDVEDEDGKGPSQPRGFFVSKSEKHLHLMTALFVLLCKHTEDLVRVRALVGDLLTLNLPSAGALIQLHAVARYWPEVVGKGQGTLMSRAIHAAMWRELRPVQEAVASSDRVGRRAYISSVYTEMCQRLDWPLPCPLDCADLGLGILSRFAGSGDPFPPNEKVEAAKAFEVVMCAVGVEWFEEKALGDGALQGTPEGMELLATVAREVTTRSVTREVSSVLMKRLLGVFACALTARGVKGEDGKPMVPLKLWAAWGIANLPGLQASDFRKYVMTWVTSLSDAAKEALPLPFLRQVGGSQEGAPRALCLVH
jgi:hypothetical protein